MGLCICRRSFLLQWLLYSHGAFHPLFWAQLPINRADPSPHFVHRIYLVSHYALPYGARTHLGVGLLSACLHYCFYLLETQQEVRMDIAVKKQYPQHKVVVPSLLVSMLVLEGEHVGSLSVTCPSYSSEGFTISSRFSNSLYAPNRKFLKNKIKSSYRSLCAHCDNWHAPTHYENTKSIPQTARCSHETYAS